eukprot:Trichotokara_eunicae@DN9206_c0_g1_i1.p1
MKLRGGGVWYILLCLVQAEAYFGFTNLIDLFGDNFKTWFPLYNQQSSNSKSNTAVDLKPAYDFIVVGGGCAGSPFAATLAEAGFDVLLIERGGSRTDHPLTLDIYGAGISIGDPEVSQLV